MKKETIETIKLADKCRNFIWIRKIFEEGKLMLRGEIFNKESFDKFRLAIKSVQEVYENSWDLDIKEEIQTDSEDQQKINSYINIIGIVIAFDSIEIKNSNNKKHLIEQLYVRISLKKRGTNIQIDNVQGGRTKISYAEYCSNYFHSHLPGGYHKNSDSRLSPPFYKTFCTGSGHIRQLMMDLNEEGFTQARFTPFLVQILGLISWESIEGGPHRRMEKILVSSNQGVKSCPTIRSSKHLLILIKKYYIENQVIPDIEIALEAKKYTIIDNNKFAEFLTKNISIPDELKKNTLCMQDAEGVLYQWGNLPGYPAPKLVAKKYIFQGNKIPFTIGPSPEIGDLSNIQYFINPIVKNFIKQELEYDINIKKIRKSTVDRYSNKIGNTTNNTKPDKVVV